MAPFPASHYYPCLLQVRTHAQKYFVKLEKNGKSLSDMGLPDRPDVCTVAGRCLLFWPTRCGEANTSTNATSAGHPPDCRRKTSEAKARRGHASWHSAAAAAAARALPTSTRISPARWHQVTRIACGGTRVSHSQNVCCDGTCDWLAGGQSSVENPWS